MKAMIRDNRGFTIKELLLVFIIVFALIYFLQPLALEIGEEAHEIICANNMRETGKALYIYAKEHNGDFPPSLKVLYEEEYLADKRIMDCPAAKEEIGTPDNPDYSYVSGLSVRDPSGAVLVQDKGGNHATSGMNVLYLDGRVKWERE
jgi:prepilin-type processing-associated H-X9-DG protein